MTMSCSKLFLWVSGLLFELLVLKQLLLPTYAHKYKLTVHMEVDGRQVSGSGVTLVKYNYLDFLRPLFQADHDVELNGRAALVDLEKRGIVLVPVRMPTS